jgi:hypothetical protein
MLDAAFRLITGSDRRNGAYAVRQMWGGRICFPGAILRQLWPSWSWRRCVRLYSASRRGLPVTGRLSTAAQCNRLVMRQSRRCLRPASARYMRSEKPGTHAADGPYTDSVDNRGGRDKNSRANNGSRSDCGGKRLVIHAESRVDPSTAKRSGWTQERREDEQLQEDSYSGTHDP